MKTPAFTGVFHYWSFVIQNLSLQNKLCFMSLLNNNKKQKGKKDNKNPKAGDQGSKFFNKSNKSAGFSQRPPKAGGMRGS